MQLKEGKYKKSPPTRAIIQQCTLPPAQQSFIITRVRRKYLNSFDFLVYFLSLLSLHKFIIKIDQIYLNEGFWFCLLTIWFLKVQKCEMVCLRNLSYLEKNYRIWNFSLRYNIYRDRLIFFIFFSRFSMFSIYAHRTSFLRQAKKCNFAFYEVVFEYARSI